ncbi:MAG: hydratase [Fusobacterium sp.]|nr:hydratase [Fusobacterium sp.]
MIKLYETGVFLKNGNEIIEEGREFNEISKEAAKKNTISYSILESHNISGNMEKLNIKFDCMASHDITYVGIIQTAKASGLEKFPIPYVLTNCHNSLCAVGGTINEDDHTFGFTAAKKYGGIYVPAHEAVIHQYMREMMSGCGKMILGSDSHTRYGALGTIAIGEGGPELVKQLLSKTYDIDMPKVVGIYLKEKPRRGIGPQDIALTIIGKVFKNGFVKNKIMEFIGEGVSNLDVEFRNGVDVMTTETTCLSSVWRTDEKVREYYKIHGREEEYKELNPKDIAYYDSFIEIDLSKIESMIALPFHPSNVYSIKELNANLKEILEKVEREAKEELGIEIDLRSKIVDGKFMVDQGIIAGCAGGTFDNIVEAAGILNGQSIGNENFSLSVYPSSQPTYIELVKNGSIAKLMLSGAVLKTAFCGPCFGAGDTPANNGFSIRHTTRNFPNREGSKPGNNQISSVALVDARSIAATALNKGILTAATEVNIDFEKPAYAFSEEVYKNRVYNGFEKEKEIDLTYGPNIADWPEMPALTNNILLKVVSVIEDPVTTTDELIPSGETSSYRSNPFKLAEFTLSRKDPNYVGEAKKVLEIEAAREKGKDIECNDEMKLIFEKIKTISDFKNIIPAETLVGSTIYAIKPGDGSAREQAASCQKVLGGQANIAVEYATKRYRSNLINWGMLPLLYKEKLNFKKEDYIFIPNIKSNILDGIENFKAYVVNKNEIKEIKLQIDTLTSEEKKIISAGCLINYYRENSKR